MIGLKESGKLQKMDTKTRNAGTDRKNRLLKRCGMVWTLVHGYNIRIYSVI